MQNSIFLVKAFDKYGLYWPQTYQNQKPKVEILIWWCNLEFQKRATLIFSHFVFQFWCVGGQYDMAATTPSNFGRYVLKCIHYNKVIDVHASSNLLRFCPITIEFLDLKYTTKINTKKMSSCISEEFTCHTILPYGLFIVKGNKINLSSYFVCDGCTTYQIQSRNSVTRSALKRYIF